MIFPTWNGTPLLSFCILFQITVLLYPYRRPSTCDVLERYHKRKNKRYLKFSIFIKNSYYFAVWTLQIKDSFHAVSFYKIVT